MIKIYYLTKKMNTFFNKKNETKLFWALVLLNVFFVVYYCILIYYSRLAQDDYDFLNALKKQGIFDFVKTVYFEHQGRFVAFFIQGIKYKLIEKTGIFAFVPISVFSISVSSLYFFLSKFFNSFSKKILFLISLLLINIFLTVNFEFSSFFWVAACSSIGLAAPLLLFAVLFYNSKKISWLYITILSIIIGGISEAFAPLMLFILFATACGMIFFRKEKSIKDVIFSSIFKKLTFSFCIISVCFIIVYIAPGNANRLGQYEQPNTLIQLLLIMVKNVIKFSYLFIFKLPYILCISFLAFVTGLGAKKQFYIPKKYLVFSLIVLLSVIWLSTFPAAYAMSGFGFQRIYAPVVFWLLLYCCFAAFYLGNHFYKEKFVEKTKLKLLNLLLICIIFVSIMQIVNITHDTPVVRAYSLADKKRIDNFLAEKEKGRTEPIYFDALPSTEVENIKSFLFYDLLKNKNIPNIYFSKTELYYSNDIDTDIVPNTFIGYGNQMMMDYYDLPFSIYLKK